jgi:predicted nucleotidyltransferase
MMNLKLSEKDAKALEDFKNNLISKHRDRIDQIVLYGSKARGDARKDSDIDVMVVMRSGSPQVVDDVALDAETDLWIKHGVDLSSMVVDRGHYSKKLDPFFKTVRREGVRVWPEK